MRRRSTLAVLICVVFLAACSGPPQTAGQSGPSAEADPGEAAGPAAITKYETFDASVYVARPPGEAVEVEHRVPARLMQGRAAEGIRRTTEGFRIQVFSAMEKQAAEDFQRQVRQWWEKNQDRVPEDVFGEQPRIHIMYSQPYYRVRLGAFADRSVAERALEFVKESYPGAFIARSTVTVMQ